MRHFMAAAVCAAALGLAPMAGAQAQDLQETLGRILQGFAGPDPRQDPRYDPREDRRHDPREGGADRRGAVYSDRWEGQDRLRALDEADRRLDAQQRQLDEDRRRVEAERRRLTR
jgi:hypothetical protein